MKSVRATGSLGVVGVFVPEDPGGPDPLSKKGKLTFDFGQFWMKGQRMATGQANVKAYNRRLCDLIHTGKATPSFIVSHELALDDAAHGLASRGLGFSDCVSELAPSNLFREVVPPYFDHLDTVRDLERRKRLRRRAGSNIARFVSRVPAHRTRNQRRDS